MFKNYIKVLLCLSTITSSAFADLKPTQTNQSNQELPNIIQPHFAYSILNSLHLNHQVLKCQSLFADINSETNLPNINLQPLRALNEAIDVLHKSLKSNNLNNTELLQIQSKLQEIEQLKVDLNKFEPGRATYGFELRGKNLYSFLNRFHKLAKAIDERIQPGIINYQKAKTLALKNLLSYFGAFLVGIGVSVIGINFDNTISAIFGAYVAIAGAVLIATAYEQNKSAFKSYDKGFYLGKDTNFNDIQIMNYNNFLSETSDSKISMRLSKFTYQMPVEFSNLIISNKNASNELSAISGDENVIKALEVYIQMYLDSATEFDRQFMQAFAPKYFNLNPHEYLNFVYAKSLENYKYVDLHQIIYRDPQTNEPVVVFGISLNKNKITGTGRPKSKKESQEKQKDWGLMPQPKAI